MIFGLAKWLGRRPRDLLARQCMDYLRRGSLTGMTSHVPDSVAETIIAKGARGQVLKPDLIEMAGIILLELDDLDRVDNPKVRAHMAEGAMLIEEIARRSR